MDLVVRQTRWVQPGETIAGRSFSTGPGGKGLNQAVAAARAGAEVAFLGSVGSDDFGARLLAVFDGEGIDRSGVVVREGTTGIAAITVTDDGENAIVVVPGANAVDELGLSDRAAIAAADYLVVQLERPLPLVHGALRFAREQGVTTVLTPAPVAKGIAELVSLADLLVPNEGEALELSGAADADEAACALSHAAGVVIVTLGQRGSIVARGGSVIARIPARPTRAVDTTGAGDTFVGVLVAWLAAGAPLEDALEAASAGASISVSREGAAVSMPRREEILATLATSPG